MYLLYTDKDENFKCSIGLEGASLTETKARLILNSSKAILLYEGSVDTNGECSIPIKKLKSLLEEGTEGTMKLEVIAEDTLFSPWEDSFKVQTSKQVTVEVKSNDKPIVKENKIKVKVKYNNPEPVKNKEIKHSDAILEILRKKGVTKSNIKENINSASRIIHSYIKNYKIEDTNSLFSEIISKISN